MDNCLDDKDFCIDIPKYGRATCKKCKQKCEAGVLRIGKLVPNHFTDSVGKMKHWYHVDCIFEVFKNQKPTTKRIESVGDIDGWDALTEADRDTVLEKFEGSLEDSHKKGQQTSTDILKTADLIPSASIKAVNKRCDDNLFSTFRNICDKIASFSAYTQKSNILHSFLVKGTNGHKFEGDIYLWFKLLLPSAVRRVYNLQSKQLVKVFSRIFRTDQNEMLIDLEQGDVSETIRKYFDMSKSIRPRDESKLTVYDIEKFLDKMTRVTREDDQVDSFQEFCQMCGADDLKTVIRLIKHDLRMNAGPRHILDALSPSAYSMFQSSRDLEAVIRRFSPLIGHNKIVSLESRSKIKVVGVKGPDIDENATGSIRGGVQLMSAISPMLAEACKSVERAIIKNPEGVYSEIKYDGERVQIHKRGTEFKFFTRNLKPVLDHKISRCKEFIPKAFPSGKDLILDSEIIVVNTKTGELLPFGTLGVHKREQFESAEVCLFVFDCIYYNGLDLTKRPLKERKKILKDNMIPIKNHVQMSEYYHLKTKSEVAAMTANVLKAGLEGLVLKSVNSFYEPGKRGWLKIKKDYLFQGQMADAADLVVLGAWFGTGKKGNLLSIFLMGCLDKQRNQWRTVTKVHSGLEDSTLDELQTELKSLMQRCNSDRTPKWLVCKKQLMPTFVAVDPTKMPVWEITGAEFTKAEAHTANGISIRFPRITKFRPDKSVAEATNLEELEQLFKNSREHINVDKLFKDINAKDMADMVVIKTKLFNLNRSFNDDDENGNGEEVDYDGGMEATSEDSKKNCESNEGNKMMTLSASIKRKRRDKDEREIPPKTLQPEMKKIQVKTDVDISCGNSPSAVKFKDTMSRHFKEDNYSIVVDQNDERDVEIRKKIKKDSALIFDDVELYISASISSKCKESIEARFLKAGGKIVENSRRAEYVIHAEKRINEDFMALRKNYRAQCRHVTYQWIEDCIERNAILPTGTYAVCL